MSARRQPAIERFGEGAYLVVLGGGIGRATSARVHALAVAVRAEADDGIAWGNPVPAYESVLVPFDPDALDADAAADRLAALVDGIGTGSDAIPDRRPIVEIATRYGGPDGPDLAEVAERLGRSLAEVVALHAGRVYVVHMLGFSPGFAYLGTLPRALAVPRRGVPRTHVPAGSVAIAARQTGVYPIASPGGWNLIGRTEAVLWDPQREPPTPLGPGRRVRFVPLPG
jgi:KipI family sensor histidine kinase inhibitor